MDQIQDSSSPSSLFGLKIDQASRAHLSEAARWGKFLSIVGFILCGLTVLATLFMGTISSLMPEDAYNNNDDVDKETMLAMTGFMTFFGLIGAALYFFLSLFLYNFATKMKIALASDNQEVLNTSFQNLKKLLRFLGILTIIVLAMYGLSIIVVIIGAAIGSL